jgi:hypothetical protein
MHVSGVNSAQAGSRRMGVLATQKMGLTASGAFEACVFLLLCKSFDVVQKIHCITCTHQRKQRLKQQIASLDWPHTA